LADRKGITACFSSKDYVLPPETVLHRGDAQKKRKRGSIYSDTHDARLHARYRATKKKNQNNHHTKNQMRRGEGQKPQKKKTTPPRIKKNGKKRKTKESQKYLFTLIKPSKLGDNFLWGGEKEVPLPQPLKIFFLIQKKDVTVKLCLQEKKSLDVESFSSLLKRRQKKLSSGPLGEEKKSFRGGLDLTRIITKGACHLINNKKGRGGKGTTLPLSAEEEKVIRPREGRNRKALDKKGGKEGGLSPHQAEKKRLYSLAGRTREVVVHSEGRKGKRKKLPLFVEREGAILLLHFPPKKKRTPEA